MKRFFISFSHDDIGLAGYIHAYFNDLFQGKASFFLSDSIEPSEAWIARLKQEIHHSHGGFFLLSPTSKLREWVNIECGALWILDKYIFPMIAGDLDVSKVHQPFAAFQATILANEPSVSRLIRKVSKICGLVTPPVYDAARFCKTIEKRMLRFTAFRNVAHAAKKLGLKAPLHREDLSSVSIHQEPPQLRVQISSGDTLSVTGNSDETKIVTLQFFDVEPTNFLLIEMANVANSQTFSYDKLLKILVNSEPVPAAFKVQRNADDRQYITRQNGVFVYQLPVTTERDFQLELVFWKCNLDHLLLRFYFGREELSQARCSMDLAVP